MLARLIQAPRNLPVCLAVLALLIALPELVWFTPLPTLTWRGYGVLLHRRTDADAVDRALAAVAPGSVTARSAEAAINAFGEIERLPVDGLTARLDGSDPRFDPWLTASGAYFRTDSPESAVAYVPARQRWLAANRRIARALTANGVSSGWRLLEGDPLRRLALAGCGALAGLGLGLCRRRIGDLVLAAAGSVVFLPLLLAGEAADFTFFAAVMLLWLPQAAKEARRARARALHRASEPAPPPEQLALISAALAAAVAALLLATGGDAYRLARIGSSLAALLIVAELPWPLAQIRGHARRSFDSMPAAGSPLARRRGIAVAIAPLAIVVVTAATALAIGPTAAGGIPAPRLAALAPAASWRGVEATASGPLPEAPGETLPGYGAAVMHAAYLATLPFGGRYQLPPRDGRWVLREYLQHGTALVEAPRTVVRFDPGWLPRLAASATRGSLERLLLDQGLAVVARPASPWWTAMRALAGALIAVLLAAQPLIRPRLWVLNKRSRSPRTK